MILLVEETVKNPLIKRRNSFNCLEELIKPRKQRNQTNNLNYLFENNGLTDRGKDI